MDFNLKWQVSLWIVKNAVDLLFWLMIAKYALDSILKNVPSAKSNTSFQLVCNLVDSACSGIKSLIPTKGVTNEKTDAATSTDSES